MSTPPVRLIVLIAGPDDREATLRFLNLWGETPPDDAAVLVLGAPDAKNATSDALTTLVLPLESGLQVLRPTRIYVADALARCSYQADALQVARVAPQTTEGAQDAGADGSRAFAPLKHFLMTLTQPAVLVFLRTMLEEATRASAGIISSRSLVVLESSAGTTDDQPFGPEAAVPAPQLFATALACLDLLTVSTTTGEPSTQDSQLDEITAIIATATQVDFSEYKSPTLLRRIQRRMRLAGLVDLEAYIALLRRSHDEIEQLQQEMLIGVTRFFRDPNSFEVLTRQIFPDLITHASENHVVRIWVAGCSTGQEVYSLAILLAEGFESAGKRIDARLFATDLDKAALTIASAGIYEPEQLTAVSPARLAKYFVKHEHHYRISTTLRELVIFAPHNMIKDPPFHRLDLITCRNVLIYLKPEVQQRLLGSFHFALNPHGYLLLGRSEQAGDMSRAFTLIDPIEKIYQKHSRVHIPWSETASGFPLLQGEGAPRPLTVPTSTGSGGNEESLVDAIRHTLLQEFILNFIVVDESFEIRHISGDMSRFLMLPQGKPNHNILKMVSPVIAIALSTGIRRAISGNQTVVYDQVPSVGTSNIINRITIRPFLHRSDYGKLAVVVLESASPAQATSDPVSTTFDLSFQSQQRIADLELELSQTALNLRMALEELETSNEEMQATNEEILAANEELQSSNEELHSVNEELTTVNLDCKAKIADLSSLNYDILNSLTAASISTIFLDRQLQVRKFTHSATKQVNLIDSDIGRPLGHLTNNIRYPSLAQDAERVLKTLVPLQCDVQTDDDRWYAMRIVPYRTQDDEVKGITITFVDISNFTPMHWLTREGLSIPHQVSMVLLANAQGDIEYINPQVTSITGWTFQDLVGQGSLLRPSGMANVQPEVRRSLEAGRPWTGELSFLHKDGRLLTSKTYLLPIHAANSAFVQILALSVLTSSPSPADATTLTTSPPPLGAPTHDSDRA